MGLDYGVTRSKDLFFDRYPRSCFVRLCFCLKLGIQNLIWMVYDTLFCVVTRLEDCTS
jgi:hypothetical protein